MELEKDVCPIVKVDGFIEKGKQFDMEIIVPEDDRSVIYGVLHFIPSRRTKSQLCVNTMKYLYCSFKK